MRGVKWRIYVPAEVITEYAGVKLREYYTNNKSNKNKT